MNNEQNRTTEKSLKKNEEKNNYRKGIRQLALTIEQRQKMRKITTRKKIVKPNIIKRDLNHIPLIVKG